jgi:hypothetical protein
MSDRQDLSKLTKHIIRLKDLLREGLEAGLFVSPGATWRSHFNGEVLYFADRVFGIEKPAVLVVADEISPEIITASVESDYRSYVVIGGWLSDSVDLGSSRLVRIDSVKDLGEHYWATFVLQDGILVNLGTPLSWCRLVGEILNTQFSTPFVQRRVCGKCHALNEYHTSVCHHCRAPLMLTTRLHT